MMLKKIGSLIRQLVLAKSHDRKELSDSILRDIHTSHGRLFDQNCTISPVHLSKVIENKDAVSLSELLTIGFSSGFNPQLSDLFIEILKYEWHDCHEDIVSALQSIGAKDPQVIEALCYVTEWVPKLLKWDESRALARKALWALRSIDNEQAALSVKAASKSNKSSVVRGYACEVISSWGAHRA